MLYKWTKKSKHKTKKKGPEKETEGSSKKQAVPQMLDELVRGGEAAHAQGEQDPTPESN